MDDICERYVQCCDGLSRAAREEWAAKNCLE